MRYKFSPEVREHIVHRFRMGEEISKLAAHYSTSPSTILAYIDEIEGVRENKHPSSLPKYTKEEWDAIAEKYKGEEGASFVSYAEKYDVSRRIVSANLKARGCRPKTEMYPKEVRDKVAEAYRGGMSSQEISEKFGVGKNFPARAAREKGYAQGRRKSYKKLEEPDFILRDKAIKLLREGGFTFEEIGRIIDLTGAGVRLRMLK